MDVRTLMRRAALHYSSREAIVHNDTRLTFAQAWERGVRLANGLLSMGLKPGDRVGVLEDNSVEAADLFQAAAIANLVRVPLYPRNGRPAHTHMLGHTNCRALLVSEVHAHEVEGLQQELPDLEHIFVRDSGYESGWPVSHRKTPTYRCRRVTILLFVIREARRGSPRVWPIRTRLGSLLGGIGFTPFRR